jgi:hypothetical protein
MELNLLRIESVIFYSKNTVLVFMRNNLSKNGTLTSQGLFL